MGFGHLPQWIQHESVEGICLRCGRSLPYEGAICTKAAFDRQEAKTFQGSLPFATDCLSREESNEND